MHIKRLERDLIVEKKHAQILRKQIENLEDFIEDVVADHDTSPAIKILGNHVLKRNGEYYDKMDQLRIDYATGKFDTEEGLMALKKAKL